MNTQQNIFLTLVITLFSLTIPLQTFAVGTPASIENTFQAQGAKHSELSRAPLFVHIVSANTGSAISGALVWFDGFLAGSADSFGVVGISVTHPSLDHNYVASAGGYQVEKGTITIGSTSDGHFTVRLTPRQ